MMQSINIKTITASYQPKKKFLLCSIYDNVTERVSISNVRIESVGSADQDGHIYQVRV